MREIKFRVWDKKETNFIKNCVLKEDGSIARPIMKNDYDISPLNPNDFDVNFYTGLEDNNNKEIYEGDILKDNRTNEIFFVKFSVGEFVAVIKNKEVGRLAIWLLGDKCEILGNIYQNKELLK